MRQRDNRLPKSRPTYCAIDLAALCWNFQQVRKTVWPDVKILSVVKVRCGSGLAITHCCNARRDPNFRKYIDVSNAEWQDMAPIFKIVKEALKAGEAR
jgi:hypothetical protein